MTLTLTPAQYAHLRIIHEYQGDCDKFHLHCSECPLKMGHQQIRQFVPSLFTHRPGLPNSNEEESRSLEEIRICVPIELRYKIATEILSMDITIKGLLVEDKI